MEKSEILDAFSEAEVHFGALWACFVVIPFDDEALNNEELAEAWCKDAEESAKKIKTICDSLINENVSPRAKCGKWLEGRLRKLGEDARKLHSALIGLQFPKYEVKYCLQMNIAAIANNIRDVWRETALKVEKNEDEASTLPKAEAESQIKEDELKPYFQVVFYNTKNGGIDWFAHLLEDLRQERTAKDFARIAYMIYDGGYMLPTKRPSTFSKWYQIFCDLVGCERKTYKPNDVKDGLDVFFYLKNPRK